MHLGVIVNNVQLIFPVNTLAQSVTSSAIHFHDKSTFWSFYNGGYKFYEEVNKGVISTQGDNLAIDLFLKKIVKSKQIVPISNDVNGVMNSPIVSAITEKKFPLKEGFLLKKVSFLSGWKGRYFVVYPGRFEYYTDVNDKIAGKPPKAVIDLLDAQIYTASKCNVHGEGDHWSWIVEPHSRYKEKAFRLASERKAEEGQVDAFTWVQVFEIAASRPRGKDAQKVLETDKLSSTSTSSTKSLKVAAEAVAGETKKFMTSLRSMSASLDKRNILFYIVLFAVVAVAMTYTIVKYYLYK